MDQIERYRITVPDEVPAYVYVGPQFNAESYRCPHELAVSYRYPYEIVLQTNDRRDLPLSETKAIRRELSQIKNDIREIKRQQTAPKYYIVKEDSSTNKCPLCNSTTAKVQPKQYTQVPMYYCEKCHSFVEQRTYSATPIVRAKTPNTTYQDSYRPPPYALSHSQLERQITLNEIQTQPPSSPRPVQHPRNWIPAASRNQYPHRRWNLSVPHSEP